MKIIFFGTPDFAVASLDKILQAGFEVSAVVTSVDKPAGRGLKIHTSAVKDFAVQKGLPVLQPTNLKNPEFQETLRSFNADLFVIIAFRMLPEAVWNMPPLGSINLHASLLPDYRGAAPINHAIINGEKVTGLTTFFLKHEIDTGDMLMQVQVNIESDDNAGTLHDKLMHKGAEVMVETLRKISSGNYNGIPQKENSENKTAPKLSKEFCRIDWNQPTEKVYNKIRGLSPYPAAWTTLNGLTLKLYEVTAENTDPKTPPASIDSDAKSYFKISCTDGSISLREIQIEGKKRMKIDEFLRGFRMENPVIS